MTEREAFDSYIQHRPSGNEALWLPAYEVISPRFDTWELLPLGYAAKAAESGDRNAFDAVCARIRARLWPEGA